MDTHLYLSYPPFLYPYPLKCTPSCFLLTIPGTLHVLDFGRNAQYGRSDVSLPYADSDDDQRDIVIVISPCYDVAYGNRYQPHE